MALSTLIVVDGPNLYNDAARHLASSIPSSAQSSSRKNYFRRWFDVDRLVAATLIKAGLDRQLNPWGGLGTVVFHSHKKLGSDNTGSLLSGRDEVTAFWSRQGSADHTSTMLVELAGAPQGKETGVDTSIVVHLFETMDSWEAAILFTNDADLAPAVWSLRRRGKRLYCSSPASPADDAPRPLIQASQHFIRWDLEFLRADCEFFDFLQPSGGLDQFLALPDAQDLKVVSVEQGILRVVKPTANIANAPQLKAALSPVLPTGFRVDANPMSNSLAIVAPGGNGALVFNGIDRHAVSLSGARWHPLWVSGLVSR